MTQRDTNHQPVQMMFPQSGNAAIYARVAQSQEKQTEPSQIDPLTALALARGYTQEHVTIYQDNGISGKATMKERVALTALVQAIQQGSIQIVFVSNEDRLFRDADAMQVSLFMHRCIEHHVQLITPDTVYDFTNPALVTLFRFRCEQSTMYLEQVIKGRTRKRSTSGNVSMRWKE